jgi:putative ABC transport system permease protein
LYREEEQTAKIIRTFSFIAIFIACLGLFGLAAYTAERRTKEIGIRKVLGATVSNLIVMLSSEFTKWVLIANIIAWPVAYLATNQWLQNFAYRTSIKFWVFVFAAGLAFLISLMTVSYQAIKAAIANPIDSLRYE